MTGADKLTPRLAEKIDAVAGSAPVEVVVELRVQVPVGGTRQERITALKQQFERELAPVAERIADAGGQVLETAWLNHTLRSRLPADAVPAVAEDEAVAAIDLPQQLTADD